MNPEKIRNIAIIAHVDHGKTTLIDAFIKQTHILRENQEEMKQEQILDKNDLEREKGITITAKNISIPYKGYKINIIDTPGHADFGGEVERTLNMAEGCLLLVDAQEGVMPQTRFVLKRALEIGLKPIVVINKIDKKYAEPETASKKIQDLFLNLATDPEQLDFKTFYAIGRQGKVFVELPKEKEPALSDLPGDTTPLLDEIIETIPAPTGDAKGPFQMQVSSIDFDSHHGKYLIGKVKIGQVAAGETVSIVNSQDPEYEQKGRIKRLCVRNGLEYEDVKSVGIGEIAAITGLGDDVSIGDTLCEQDNPEALPVIKISPPSLKIKFEANTSPFLGKEGTYANLNQLQNRLETEGQTNVSLKIERNNDGSYYVSGRGELHLSILIETLRREGYEFQVRKPEVIITEVDGKKMEPMEEVYVDIPEEHFSIVSQKVSQRKGELVSIEHSKGHTILTYKILARNLIGLRRILLTATKGSLIISNNFLELVPYQGEFEKQGKGRIVSSATGTALAYPLNFIQDRGQLFVQPGTEVYKGMIIGISKYDNDIEVNPIKAREKSAVRVSQAVITDVSLKSPIEMTLEYAISILKEDEILEVTPKNLRLRRKFLDRKAEFDATKRLKKKK